MLKRNMYSAIKMCLQRLNKDKASAWINAPTRTGILFVLIKFKHISLIALISGWTPLMSACGGKDMRIPKLFLDYGADINAAMGTGWTALHAAAKNNNIGLVQLLIRVRI